MNHLSSIATMIVLAGLAMFAAQDSASPKPVTAAHKTAAVAAPVKAEAKSDAKTDTRTDAPKYEPTPEEAKDLEIAQLRAQLAQTQYATEAQKLPSFAQFQTAMQQLQGECKKVASENKWPGNVQCDVQQSPVKFCVGQLPCPSAAGK